MNSPKLDFCFTEFSEEPLWRPGSLKEEVKPKQSEAKEEVEVMILTQRS